MRVLRLFLLLLATLAGCGGSDDAPASTSCVHNSDCAGGLVCLFATCARPCVRDRDCDSGARCLATKDGAGCVAPAQASCTTSCPAGTICAIDGQCRSSCDPETLPCLNGQACVGASCYGQDPSHDPSGSMVANGGASGSAGSSGHPSAGSGGASGSGAGHGGSPAGGSGGAAGKNASGAGGGVGGDGGSGGDGGTGGDGGSGVGGNGGATAGSGGAACGVTSGTTCNAGEVVCGPSGSSACNLDGSMAVTTTCAAPAVCSETVSGGCQPNGHVLSVQVGWGTACAQTTSGVSCWGDNANDLLGSGDPSPFFTTAQPVPGLGPVRRVVVTNTARCALLLDSTVACWGKNAAGVLGVPGQPSGISHIPDLCGVTSIATVYLTVCVSLADGTVSCWGAGDSLGDGSGVERAMPGIVPGVTDVVSVAGTGPVCALHRDRTVTCWGRGVDLPVHLSDVAGVVEIVQGAGTRIFFRLQNGDVVYVDPISSSAFSSPSMVDTSALTHPIVQMSAGGQLCMLLDDGSVWCDDPMQKPPKPALVSGLGPGKATMVSSGFSVDGFDVLCAVEKGGSVVCSGADPVGELGYGKPESIATPVVVSADAANGLFASQHTSFALASDRTLRGWGFTYAVDPMVYQTTDSTVLLAGNNTLASVAVGDANATSILLDTAGKTTTFTYGTAAMHGLESVFAADTLTQVIAGEGWYAGLTASGFVDVILGQDGANSWSVLGDGGPGMAGDHAALTLPAKAVGIAGSHTPARQDGHLCAFTATESHCWGTNDIGQAGVGLPDAVIAAPTKVDYPGMAPSAVVAMCAGTRHTCAIVTQGGANAVYCWGDNGQSQLGVTGMPSSDVPVSVTVPDPAGLSCGGDFTWVWSTDGTAYGFGANHLAQLARPVTTATVSTPSSSPELPAVTAISAGPTHACAVMKSDGSVRCWGDNYFGEVGTIPTSIVTSPVTVMGL